MRTRGSRTIKAGEKKLTDVTASVKKWEKYEKDRYWGAPEIDKVGEGNPWV